MNNTHSTLLELKIRFRRKLIKQYIKLIKPKSLRDTANYWPDMSYKDHTLLFRKKPINTLPINSLVDLYCNTAKCINIIGSGPSVRCLDYSTLLHDRNIFLNGSISLAIEFQLPVFAFIIMDATFVKNRFELIQSLAEPCHLLLGLGAACAIAERDSSILERHKITIFTISKGNLNDFYSDGVSYFSNNLDFGFFDGGTVMSVAIQLAYHLRPETVNLLGLDIGNSGEPRFYELKGKALKSGLLKDYETKILPFMTLTSKCYSNKKIDLFNCSSITKLPYEVIPFRSDFENIKKVVLIIPTLQGNGAERFTLNLYEALEKYENFECHIICFEKKNDFLINKHIRLHIIELCSKSKKSNSKKIDSYIYEKIGIPSLVLSNLTYTDKIMKFSKLNGVFHVIHNTTSIEHLHGRKNLKRFIARKKINAIYTNHPCICVSKGVKDDLIKNFNINTNLSVIYNLIEPEHVRNQSNLTHSYFTDKPYFIHVGKFNRAKNHKLLIESYYHSDIDEPLLLLGQGEGLNEIKSLVYNLNLQDKVIFCGQQENPYPFIKNAKGLILSSNFEGLPTVLIEAITLDIPILSTNCPSGPKEIITNFNSLIPVNDVIALSNAMRGISSTPENYKNNLKDVFTAKHSAKEYAKLVK